MISTISRLIHEPFLTRAAKTNSYKKLPLSMSGRLHVLLAQQQSSPILIPGSSRQFHVLPRVVRLQKHRIVPTLDPLKIHLPFPNLLERFCPRLLNRHFLCYSQTPTKRWRPILNPYQNRLLWKKYFLHQIVNPHSLPHRYSHSQSAQKNGLESIKKNVFKNPHEALFPKRFAAGSIGIGSIIPQDYSDLVLKIEALKEFIVNHPLEVGAITFIAAGFFAWRVYKERRPDLNVKIEMQDPPPAIEEIKKFVHKFNTAKKASEPIAALFNEALEQMDRYRYLGNLSPRRHPHPDIPLARLGFLTLTECEDFAIRYEAFKQLKKLLKQSYDTTESIANLLLLEYRIGEKLKKMSEVNDPISFLHEQIICYNLILEKIFLSTLQASSDISKTTKLDMILRAREISKRLTKNPAFQYEALNAQTLSEHLATPSQIVTETVSAFFALESLYPETRADVRSFLLESLTTKQGLDKLKQFIFDKGPAQFKRVEKILLRLKENWVKLEKNTDLYASILLSKPHWHSSVTDNSIQVIQKTLKVTPKDEKNWIALYRLVEVLSEISISHGKDNLRQQAFDEMVHLIEKETAWQVRYKIGSVLLQLKNDLLFEDQAEEYWKKHLATPVANPRMEYALRLFAAVQEKIKIADQRLKVNRHLPLLGKLKDRIDSMQQDLLISREVFLKQLADQFAHCSHPLPIQIILGMRGGGKTTLATTYAQKYAKDYTLIHWIDAGTLEQDLDRLADRIGIPTVESQVVQSTPERMELLKKWLEDNPNQGWLLVIDQVDPNDCQKIKNFLPRFGGHLLLTTYYEHRVKEQFASPLILQLPLFSMLEATHYLLQKEKHIKEDKIYAQNICEELGYLPLPLSHARAYIEKMGCSLADYLRLYQKYKTQLFESSMATTWDMNLAEIKKSHPLALELLSFLAELYPQDIPYSLIQIWQSLMKQNASETEIFATLKILKEFAVISGSKSVCNMHPFLQEAIKKNSTSEEQNIHLHHALEVMHVAVHRIDFEDPKTWSSMSLLHPHYDRLIQKTLSQENSELISGLHHQMGMYFIKSRNFAKARTILEKALAIQRKLYKTDEHLAIATSLNSLGWVLATQGDLISAKVNHEQALTIRRKLYKADDNSDVATSLNNLGWVLRGLGDLVNGKTNLEQALAIRRKVAKTDENPAVATSLNNLGVVLREQGVDLVGAKTYHEQALAIRKKLYKTDEHPDVATSLNDLGRVLQAQGDLVGAKANHEQALAIRRKLYKTDEHPNVAASLNNLGVILRKQGDLVGAKATHEQALAIRRKYYKTDEHPDIAASLNHLGWVLQDQGDLIGAKANYEQALVIRRKIYKTDKHPAVADSLQNLGKVFQAQGDLVSAKANYEQALAIRIKLYKTDEHPSIKNTLKDLDELQKKIESK